VPQRRRWTAAAAVTANPPSEPAVAAGPLGPGAGPLGPGAGPLGPDAGPLGPDAGPLGPDAGPLGPDAGPPLMARPEQAGRSG